MCTGHKLQLITGLYVAEWVWGSGVGWVSFLHMTNAFMFLHIFYEESLTHLIMEALEEEYGIKLKHHSEWF